MRVIAGSARSLKLTAPDGLKVRPTTDRIKETLFNIISSDLYDCAFLDLFCGSGAIGIEALSRGADRAVFVDDSSVSCECTRKNLEHTKLAARAEIIRCDAARALTRLAVRGDRFDIIVMDPPYNCNLEKSVLEEKHICDILNSEGYIIVEADSGTSFEYVESLGFEVYREKSYGSNKHVFLRILR